ncbi:MAG: RimK/LysX family protein [Candidatus Saccharimonadales bacterium]
MILSMEKIVLGHVEKLSIPILGITDVIAKIDTGAFSGALHCTNIHLSDDNKTLSFDPMGQAEHRTVTNRFQALRVRSASGHEARRFRIPVDIELRGLTYPTTIGITDRSDMGREILIGRRFLRANNMIVDVTINGEHDEEWKRVNL